MSHQELRLCRRPDDSHGTPCRLSNDFLGTPPLQTPEMSPQGSRLYRPPPDPSLGIPVFAPALSALFLSFSLSLWSKEEDRGELWPYAATPPLTPSTPNALNPPHPHQINNVGTTKKRFSKKPSSSGSTRTWSLSSPSTTRW